MNLWFLAAAFAAAATCLTHLIVGGRYVATPLLAVTNLTRVSKYTNYYCWHLVTITIAGLAAGFAYAGLGGEARAFGMAATAAALLFALWNGAMIVLFRLPPLKFPQWALFLIVSVFGLFGMLA